MALDRYTEERLVYARIADHQRLAETLGAFEGAAEDRRQEEPREHRWLSRLLQPLAVERIPGLNTLRRL